MSVDSGTQQTNGHKTGGIASQQRDRGKLGIALFEATARLRMRHALHPFRGAIWQPWCAGLTYTQESDFCLDTGRGHQDDFEDDKSGQRVSEPGLFFLWTRTLTFRY